MAGHSKFKTIKHRKGLQDARRSKLFSKLARDIYIAAKAGADPECNQRLRSVLAQAKVANLPRDAVERAIAKAAGGADADDYVQSYRGGFMFGVAVLVTIVTDNLARAHAVVKEIFHKHGVVQSKEANVLSAFSRLGMIRYSAEACESEAFFLLCAEFGALDVQILQDEKVCYTSEDSLHRVLEALEGKLGSAKAAEMCWHPKQEVEILDDEKLSKLDKFKSALEDLDDVEDVTLNLAQYSSAN